MAKETCVTQIRRRPLLVFSALTTLACGGVFGPTHERHTFQAFSIDMLGGTVGEQEDKGLEGNIDVKFGAVSQAVVWRPQDASLTDITLASLWDLTRDMLGSEGVEALPKEMPTPQDVPAGDKVGRGWSWTQSGIAWAAATAVQCPSSGVEIVVFTGGLKVFGDSRHADTLASIVCAASPPAASTAPLPRAFVFTGGPAWEEKKSDPEMGTWANGRAFLVVASTGDLGDDDPQLRASICHAGLSSAMRGLGDDYTVEPASVVTVDTPDGCRQDLRAFSTETQENARIRTTVVRCPGQRSLMAVCLAWEPDASVETCEGTFGCAAVGGP
jgi:hypothetical protein